jgi:hypothetical protein
MADKFVTVGATGSLTESEATVTSTGASEAGKIVALDTAGKLDNSVMPTGIGADTKILPASENLSAGNIVNVWNDSGTAKVRKADGSDAGKFAVGFVLSSVNLGENATVYFEGTITGLTSLTPGDIYWLSDTTPGGTTNTAVITSGSILQPIGYAVSATEISFEPGEFIIRA